VSTHAATAVAVIALAAAAVPSAASGQSAAAPSRPTIDTLSLRSHVRFLSSDLLEGRAAGSRGEAIAREYLVAQLDRMGLQGAGPGGSFLVPVPLQGIGPDPGRTKMTVRGDAGPRTIPSSAFHFQGGTTRAWRSFRGPIVPGGSMATALATLKAAAGGLRGRVVVMTAARGAPSDSIFAELARAGAAGAVVVIPDSNLYTMLRHARGSSRVALDVASPPPGVRDFPAVVVGPATAQLLAERGAEVAVELVASRHSRPAWTIAARLPGTDSTAGAVAYMAHYDHVGFGRPVGNDSLYNGFVDNAGGAAMLLAIADAARATPRRRSMLFLFFTAEEEGSLGSALWVADPANAAGRLAAAFNLDLPAPLGPARDWFLEGADRSSLGALATRVGSANGWTIASAPALPNSDHWNFLARGVPTGFLVPGEDWEGIPPERRDSLIERWWRPHRPDDVWDADYPLGGMRRMAEVALALGEAAASDPAEQR